MHPPSSPVLSSIQRYAGLALLALTLHTAALADLSTTPPPECPALYRGFVAKPSLRIAYDRVIPGTPIVKQCSGTCWLESGVALIESSTGKALASEYNVLQTIREGTAAALADLKKAQARDGYVDVLARGKTFKNALKTLARQGVVLREDFELTPAFLEKIQRFREMLRKMGAQNVESLTPLQVLNVSIGVILSSAKKQAKDRKLSAEAFGQIKAMIDQLLSSATAGIKKDVDPHQNFDQLFGRERIDVFTQGNFPSSGNRPLRKALFKTLDQGIDLFNRSAFRFHNSPGSTREFEAQLVSHLQKGKNVWLHFYRKTDLIAPDTGIARLTMPIEEQKKLIQSQKDEYARYQHGAVIEGYKLDAQGNLEWLLIKDSQGTGLYDQGYIHMHVDYFRAMFGYAALFP